MISLTKPDLLRWFRDYPAKRINILENKDHKSDIYLVAGTETYQELQEIKNQEERQTKARLNGKQQ